MSAGRILVVDDEPQIRRIMRTALTTAGYEVEDAKTGEEALGKVRDYRPDLVLLDINMPGMGGLAACRALRADPNVAIVMLTVHNTEAAKVEALDAGADDFVSKPFSTPELLARIRAVLRRAPVAQSSATRLRIGDLTIDFAARSVAQGTTTAHLTQRNWIFFVISHSTRTQPSHTGNSCKQCGDRTTVTKSTTFAPLLRASGRRLRVIRITRNTSLPSPGSDIASTEYPNLHDFFMAFP